MRSLALFLSLFVAAAAVMAVLSYPAWELASEFGNIKFHRVGNRLGMLTLGVGLVLLARRLQVANRLAMGYGLPRWQFVAELAKALLLGIAMMLPVAAALLLLQLRIALPGIDVGQLAYTAMAALGTGLVVAFIEESFLRGAMYSAVRREGGVWLAVVGTALLYAAIHFIGRLRIPPEQLGWLSGLQLVRGSLHALADPLQILDAFLCLAAVGVLLALVREVTGSIAACIGLHAGWVTVIAATRNLSEMNGAHASTAWVSSHDGFVGWLVLGWSMIAGPALYAFYRRRGRRSVPGALDIG